MFPKRTELLQLFVSKLGVDYRLCDSFHLNYLDIHQLAVTLWQMKEIAFFNWLTWHRSLGGVYRKRVSILGIKLVHCKGLTVFEK